MYKRPVIITGVLVVMMMMFVALFHMSTDDDEDILSSFYHTTNSYSFGYTTAEVSTYTIASNVEPEADPDADATTGTSGSSSSTSPSMPGIGNHTHIAWNQYRLDSSKSMRLGTTTLGGGGCGWCSLSAAMAYLCPSVCANRSPVDWLQDSVLDSVECNWVGGVGMLHSAPEAWFNVINSLPGQPYGEYTCVNTGASTTSACLDIVLQNAGDTNKCVLISSGNGGDTLFTGGGHMIMVLDLVQENGITCMHIADSSTKAKSNLGKATWEEMVNFGFPTNVTELNGKPYAWKAAWVITRTK